MSAAFLLLAALAADPGPVLPPLSDLARFPDLVTAEAELDAARRHLTGLRIRAGMERRPPWVRQYALWDEEQRAAVAAWEALAEAARAEWDYTGAPVDPCSRRAALARLRDLLEGDYWLGRMPPCCPRWDLPQTVD